MIALEYESTKEQSPLSFVEYTQHTENTSHIIYYILFIWYERVFII